MKICVTADEMKNLDQTTIEKIHIPSLVLMERAALSVCNEIIKRFHATKKVLIVSSTGNNGADGFAIGRLLQCAGYEVTFVLLGEYENCTDQMKQQIAIINGYANKDTNYAFWESKIDFYEYDIIVDAILGVGTNRDLDGRIKETVVQINHLNAFKIAVDIPTGIDATTGKVLGDAVKVDVTVTFSFVKLGCLFYPAKEYCGELLCKDIGITQESFYGVRPSFYSMEPKDIQSLPPRKSNGNKGSFGKLLLIAGSEKIAGAAYLSAFSALRSGIGMVKVITHKVNKGILQTALPEVLLEVYETKEEAIGAIRDSMDWASVYAIGPGIGTDDIAMEMVKFILTHHDSKNLLVDADGLNCIAKDKNLINGFIHKTVDEGDVIFTPHLAEFSRLINKSIFEINCNLIHEIKEFSNKYHITLVAKDAVTLCCTNGEEIYINTSGNNAMATAGSGDVLFGIMCALEAQLKQAKISAPLSVYIHGVAGDLALQKSNAYSVVATDLIEQLKYTIKGDCES